MCSELSTPAGVNWSKSKGRLEEKAAGGKSCTYPQITLPLPGSGGREGVVLLKLLVFTILVTGHSSSPCCPFFLSLFFPLHIPVELQELVLLLDKEKDGCAEIEN